MGTTINFYRPNRHRRSVYREGKYLLNTEATEMELEVLQALREQVKAVFGTEVAVATGYKLDADTVDTGRIIIRPGTAYIDGYPIQLHNGSDHLYALGNVPVAITSADFIRLANGDASGEGIAIQLAGASVLPAGSYSLVVELKEELITANQDAFLKSANLNETTADRHRLIYNVHIVTTASIDSSPIPYTGSAAGNYVNEVEITRSGANYAIVSTTAVTGSEAIDGRNLEVVFANGNGSSTARFPTSNTDLLEYRNGVLLDSNGTPFFITNMIVTPGNSSRITMTIDLEKTRPLQLNTFQPTPVIADGIVYKIVKKDLYVTNSASLPDGRRFYRTADFTWDGASIVQEDITDLRRGVLAYDGVLDLIRNKGLRLYSEGSLFWDKTINGGYFQWSDALNISSVFDGFEWTIPASDTTTLFADDLATNEVLYVKLSDKPTGGTLNLYKGVRGVDELTRGSIQASSIFWIAKRNADDRLYLNPDLIINDQQTKFFYDVPPQRLVPQDLLTLGYNTMFDDDLYDSSSSDPSETTALYFANSYLMNYSNRVITLTGGNTVTIPSTSSFTVQVGDVIIQAGYYTLINTVNSQTSFIVDDDSGLTTASSATISQKVQTLDLRTIGTAKERIDSYYTDNIADTLVTYEDGEVQAIGNPIRTAISITSDGIDYTSVLTRPAALSQFNDKVLLPTPGTVYKIRFFSNNTTGDGISLMESFRAFMHKRYFVGTVLPAVSSGGSVGNNLSVNGFTNNNAYTLTAGQVIRMTASGIDFADPSTVPTAEATFGVLLNNVPPAATANICSNGVAPNVLIGLGFSLGDTVFLGVGGILVDEATVNTYPPGYVIREIGVALGTADLFVNISPIEII